MMEARDLTDLRWRLRSESATTRARAEADMYRLVREIVLESAPRWRRLVESCGVDAEDLAHEVYLRLVQREMHEDTPASFIALVRVVAYRELCRIYSVRKLRIDVREIPPGAEPSTEGGFGAVEARLVIERLDELAAKLFVGKRRTAEAYRQLRTDEDVPEHLGRRERGAISAARNRARRELEAALEAYGV